LLETVEGREGGMVRKVLGALVILSLLAPEVMVAQDSRRPRLGANASASAPARAEVPGPATTQQAEAQRPQPPPRTRSYRREVNRHQRRRISKGEIVFMAAIAGTSVGIGALAAGAKGVAIGGIVGGWGAYLGHKAWHWIH
jgi:hypothetical protein